MRFIKALIILLFIFSLFFLYSSITKSRSEENTIKLPPSLTAFITPTSTKYPTPTQFVFREEKLFKLVQNWKLEEDGYQYIESDFTCSVASIRLEETLQDFSHTNFDANRFCADDCIISENLARKWLFEESTFESWLDSPTHRANLEANYTHSCLKCEGNHCVQIFGYY